LLLFITLSLVYEFRKRSIIKYNGERIGITTYFDITKKDKEKINLDNAVKLYVYTHPDFWHEELEYTIIEQMIEKIQNKHYSHVLMFAHEENERTTEIIQTSTFEEFGTIDGSHPVVNKEFTVNMYKRDL